MDIFDIHNLKSEKNNAMLHYHRFKNITKLFRFIELFLSVVLLSWVSTRLPFIIRISGEYFRHLLSVIVSPLFIFLIGNVIVLTLVLKSGQITENISTRTDLYEEIVNNNNNNNDDDVGVVQPEEIVYQDKEIISEVVNSKSKPIASFCSEDKEVKDMEMKVYRRSQSENIMMNECCVELEKVNGNKLKRSETEMGRRKVDATVVNDVVDELSNEEFQRRIEGFIARQVEGDTVKAEEYYGRAILANPGDGELLSLYGKLIWDTQRDGERAKTYFDQAVIASPDDCMVMGSYAQFMWEAEDDDEEEESGSKVSVPASQPLVAAF